MLERLLFHAGSGLSTSAAAWIGIASFLLGLKRFGRDIKVPLWLLFIVLWGIIALMGFAGALAATDMISLIAVIILIVGILVYLVSLLMGCSRGEEK